jgi:transcription antitermination factor NusG
MLIMAASGAAVVPDDEIRVVRQLVETCHRLGPHPFLRSGDLVRVTSGPLIGAEGILVCRKNATRLVISIKMLGRSAAADIDASIVEPSRTWQSQILSDPSLTGAWTSA